jgi:hypothetical protein
MAGRILNRRELRKQADQAGQAEAGVSEPAAAAVPPRQAGRRKAAVGPKAPRARKVKAPPRMRARWGVFDGGMKEVAAFDYNQRANAEQKLAELRGKQKGVYFLQIVKQPIPEVEPVA